ncbi:MAG TPA: antibiotic biosynthesis monooxygenase [Dehalococcoidia bacterium]|nr:antibiotic biosynthesis monooxygenase [Dehalococcoidia bacterium]
MAHVTVFRYKTQPGKRQAILDLMDKWEREQMPKAGGFQRSVVVASNNDPDEFTSVVFWDNTENYNKNSNRPEQSAWYQEFRANLVSDPIWFDGTVAAESSA